MKKVNVNKGHIRVVIVDDEEHCIRMLKQLIGNDPRLDIVAEVSDPAGAVGQILVKKPDLLFLDVQMPGYSGFDILESIEKTTLRPIVIFVTAFNEYAIKAIRAAAFDYLLKPVDIKELMLSIEKAINRINQKEAERSYSSLIEKASDKKIRFNTTGGFTMIDPNEIIFIRADWNYSEIHTDKDKNEVVVINIGALEDILPHKDFARISRSVIINLRYLEKVLRIKRTCILKKNNDIFSFRIPLRRIRELEERL